MIIVTGGAGFIGSNIVKSLNDRGIDQILIVDNLSRPEKHLNLNRLKFSDYVHKDDFINNLALFKSVKTIFHQGACSNTMETDGNYMMKNNFEYSKKLLHFALQNNTDFLYASSASVYGNGDNGFREDPSCEYPLNIYAFSKLMFDNYVRNIFKQKTKLDSQICGLRYFNVYGYQENHKGKMASVAYHLMTQAKNNEAIKLFKGSENFKRDFIFIDDVVNVNLSLYDNKTSGIFNCGSGTAHSFCNIATGIQEYEKKATIEYIPFPKELEGKYQAFTEADLSNLKKTGYSAHFHTVKEGVGKYYQKFIESNGYFI
ncbi:MAG: ADP-glyceromanno-heptose 6-epimerase [Candidatus Margulisbacteria bacterium GWF2_35_9]|nr:MAG: ADP-glyceromanno-heptose 6-epimerase [Candidatus Margulisbacteria bacterium GWF2_35_9]